MHIIVIFPSLQKHALMEQVAHQTIVMQFILELAKSLKVDPRGCFRQFFEKIKVNNYWDDTKSNEIAPCLTKKKSSAV